jgi:cyclophilin family peptidyl-prolyl cis-trans isomerase
MGTEKRERQKAARAARIEAERKAEARAKRIKSIRNMVLVVIGIVVLLLVLNAVTGCSSSSGSDSASKATGTGCPPKGGSAEPVLDFTKRPPTCIDRTKTYTAHVDTTLGQITVKLDTKRTPKTTNNFVFLARWGYYDNTVIFRTEKLSGIVQGGSPHTQDNSDSGPGYTLADEGGRFSSADYGPGTLAMARTSLPDSASGQFFFLAGEGGRYLGDPAQVGPSAGSYVAFGKVTKGLDVVTKIAALDNGDGQGTPVEQVKIKKVTITES